MSNQVTPDNAPSFDPAERYEEDPRVPWIAATPAFHTEEINSRLEGILNQPKRAEGLHDYLSPLITQAIEDGRVVFRHPGNAEITLNKGTFFVDDFGWRVSLKGSVEGTESNISLDWKGLGYLREKMALSYPDKYKQWEDFRKQNAARRLSPDDEYRLREGMLDKGRVTLKKDGERAPMVKDKPMDDLTEAELRILVATAEPMLGEIQKTPPTHHKVQNI